ncbi:putative PKS/NRPS-like protein biosynthetic cluster [Steccherinum ochraceum]|uniref:Putative PKS/NRPS-like protein biosynthetic cluster n=1 Tax=Steccherinum ochraceum TaxID=92696 RepID=A0A4R0RJ86_9APHY|nr:putative PKS/NRPS-like protein biosynthetic cluster [Steccherinum ochraceum]
MALSWYYVVLVPVLYVLYVRFNDSKLQKIPPDTAALSPGRWSEKSMLETNERIKRVEGVSLLKDSDLPPKTGRRYIVVGGAGFLGGWIVLHLIRRGEDPRRIRVLDLRRPVRVDLCEGPAKDVQFVKVDISDPVSVEAAFQKPWPRLSSESPEDPLPELTVIHTAAIIRFFERHPALVHSSERVNTAGTQHLVDSARRAGASIFVYTSSGSVAVNRTRFWLWPWQKEPKKFTQIATDDESILPKRHEEFFSNYAVSKIKAERLVRAADRSPSGSGQLRTGCIRPGNGIYGAGGDLLIDRMLKDKIHPSWIYTVQSSFIYAENCSLAHLCYEQRLIELQSGGTNPDIGGQAFCVTDAGPPCTYSDVYDIVRVVSNGAVKYIYLSPTFMLGMAHLVEWYHVTQQLLSIRKSFFARFIPRITGDLIFLQPSMFALTQIHLIFDDSRARLPPTKGGLGYTGPISTLEGACKTVIEHLKSDGKHINRIYGDPEDDTKPGVGFDVTLPESAVGEVVEKIGNGLNLDATKMAN